MNNVDTRISPLPWMAQEFSRVVDLFQADRLPHALLLEGPEGVGKNHFAKCLAGFVFCERRSEAPAPCGACKYCELMAAGSHGDFRELMPEAAGKQIKVDEVRLLNEMVAGSSLLGGYKVVVLSPAEAMNINASNALLKTLEEPSPNTLIILVSHAGGRLLPTIRSRCQVIEFGLPSESELLEWLAAQGGFDEDNARRAALMAQGSPLLTLDYLESGTLAKLETMLQDMSAVLKRSANLSDVAQQWAADEPVDRMAWVVQWVGQLCKMSLAEGSAGPLFPGAEKMFHYLAEKQSPKVLSDLYQYSFLQLCNLKASNNLNPQLVFENVLGHWLALMNKSQGAKR